MLFNLADQPSVPASLHADVAIVGAGAAGLTTCRRLLDQGLSVVLLESGGLDFASDTADLNAGESIGQEYYALDHARLRFFGGTTAIWGGRCAELDPIDFTRRDWVPHSGWPLSLAELRPYYDEALRSLGLPTGGDDPAAAAEALGFDRKRLYAPRWLFDNYGDRFCFPNNHDLAAHPSCTIVCNATVREVLAAPDGESVVGLDVASIGGRELKVTARAYVLAAGGIENPRLLLASRSVQPEGLGNRHDLVGRFFMEHPQARGGKIVSGAAWRLLSAFQRQRKHGVDQARLLTPAPEVQAEEGLLNTSLTIAPRRPPGGREALLLRAYNHARHEANPTKTGRMIWRTLKRSVGALQRCADPARAWAMHKTGALDLALLVRAEQAPNPTSRVMLSEQRDALGVPRVRLDWRTSELDVRSVAGLVNLVDQELQAGRLGRAEMAEWLRHPRDGEWQTDPLVSSHHLGGFHHMGTTRMSADRRTGVTDAWGRTHDLSNLYIVGSSVFPTSGWANPTLTIIALALRTADHLSEQLHKQQITRKSLVSASVR